MTCIFNRGWRRSQLRDFCIVIPENAKHLSGMTRKKRTVIPENAKHLSGIQGIYFWIPDIPPAAEFRNDGASRATIPE